MHPACIKSPIVSTYLMNMSLVAKEMKSPLFWRLMNLPVIESARITSRPGIAVTGFWKRVCQLGLVCFFAGSVGFTEIPSCASAPPVSAPSDKTTVAVVKLRRGEVAQEVSFDAELQPFQEVELHAKVAGYLQTLKVDAGDRVAEGQEIGTLEAPELKAELEHGLAAERRSQAEINRAQAAYEDAHLAYTRLTSVSQAQSGLIALQDLDEAKARDRSAEATLTAAKEQALVAQSDVNRLKSLLNYARVTAPFAGVVTKRYVNPGALIQAGTSSSAMPLVRLSQNDKLRVVFPISMSFVARAQVGDPVEVRVTSVGKTFPGSVARFSRRVETATRTMAAEVDLPNADLKLVPGVYATVVLKLDYKKNVLVAPIEAVARDKASTTVLRVTKDNKIEERAVTVGVETPSKLEIVSGLEEGDLLIIGSRAQLKVGQSVETKLLETHPD
jgi:RND family efflux transporter MFP subunit